jgi:hypothetical protein
VVAVSGGIEKTHAGQVSPQVEVEALCRGAAVLSREDNRIAARALLWAAVAIDPQNFVAHRRLAAALLNAEDVDAAADEYARYIELLLKEEDVRRAAGELAYARAFLGDMPQLSALAGHLVPLGQIAKAADFRALDESSPPPPLALAEYAASRAPYRDLNNRDLNNWGRLAPTTAAEPTPAHATSLQWRTWFGRASDVGIGEYVLFVSLVAAAAVAIFAMGGPR